MVETIPTSILRKSSHSNHAFSLSFQIVGQVVVVEGAPKRWSICSMIIEVPDTYLRNGPVASSSGAGGGIIEVEDILHRVCDLVNGAT